MDFCVPGELSLPSCLYASGGPLSPNAGAVQGSPDAVRRPVQASFFARIPGNPRRQPGPGGAAVGGGLRGAVDARRQPGEVASGAHKLVLRDRAAGPAPRLQAFRSQLRLSVQFLLRERGTAASPAAARTADAPGAGPRAGLSRPCRRGDGEFSGRRQPGGTSAGGAGTPSRAAAPGTDPHRHQACFLLQSLAAGLQRRGDTAPCGDGAGMARPSRRHRLGRPCGRGFCLRQ